MTRQQLVIVGNPTCRRVGFWKAAAARVSWPPPIVVPYTGLLAEKLRLADFLSENTLVRFEVAADHWPTFKLLLKHGATAALAEGYDALDDDAVDLLEYDRGWLINPRQAHLGFVRLLQELEQELKRPGASSLHGEDDIALCFDKVHCQERLRRAGVSIPESFGSPRDYTEVRAIARDEDRLMVKLAHGSGAAGCVALHWSRGRVHALTPVANVVVDGQKRLYCSKRIRHLTNEVEIAKLIDRLCVEKVQVERWLPKATWQGRNFDLRIVTIDGAPRHAVMRSSRSVFTNLTLGNTRGDLVAVQQRMGPDAWQGLCNTCERVAALFPYSFTLGLDVLIRPDFARHAVLEINAFGDLLLNQLDRGEDTYTATLAAWSRRLRPTISLGDGR